MDKVTVLCIEDAGYYESEHVSGNTVQVTLQRGLDYVTCSGIMIWEEEDEEYLDEAFEEWAECAKAGEEGYTAAIVEGGRTVLYCAKNA